jgi:large subunit ribosomal protein L7e
MGNSFVYSSSNTYRYPNLKTIRGLIYKRGFGKEGETRKPIADNAIIEKNLGSSGIVSIEDMVQEIFNGGPHFKEVTKFLCTFKLKQPKGGWRKFTEGQPSLRGSKINKYVSFMI